MPLHLLHHKSYHVYNAANIERVRRDEAAADAAAAAEQARADAAAAEHRLATLRARADGAVEPLAAPPPGVLEITPETENARKPSRGLTAADRRLNATGLTDAKGHINLFPPPEKAAAAKNAEHEAERKAREDSFAAQYTMALGKPAEELRPWYSTLDGVGEKEKRREERGKREEWRKKREEGRKEWADPLVALKRGVGGLKEAEKGREEWRRRREREVGTGEREERRSCSPDGLDHYGRDRRQREVGERRSCSPDGRDEDGRRKRRKEEREHRRRGSDEREHRHRDPDSRARRSRHRSPKSDDDDHKTSTHSHSHSHSPNHDRNSSEPRSKRRSRHRSPKTNDEDDDHNHKSKHRSHTTSMHPSSKPDPALAQLRAERDAREARERQRAAELLRTEKEAETPGWVAAQGGRYSSQFGVGKVRR
ncbi:hypothetical protein EDC01DRAFT_650560 [Geopyxis carbonaria]|nr:hypothetical protein EDC01DRAFT_650560 [Geopyxis carbonaria]